MLFQKINQDIRFVDNQQLIFFQADYLYVLGSGFDENIGGKHYQNKEVGSYHVYCGMEKLSDLAYNLIHSLIQWLKMKMLIVLDFYRIWSCKK